MKKILFVLLVVGLSSYRFEAATDSKTVKVTKTSVPERTEDQISIKSIKSTKEKYNEEPDKKKNQESTSPSVIEVKEKPKHILMFHPWGTKSHRGQLNALLLGLLERGHKVTGVFPNKSDIKKEGFTEIVVEDGMANMLKMFSDLLLKEDGTSLLTVWSHMGRFLELYDGMFDQILLDYKTVTDFIELNNLTVDALIVTGMFNYNGWYLVKQYKCPLILINPMGPLPHFGEIFGNIDNPSYQPLMQLGFIEPMSFSQRLANLLYYGVEEFMFGYLDYFMPGLKSKLGISFNDVSEMSEYFSLLLLCSHFVTHNSQPYMANTVEIGGIHCRDGQPLHQDLQQFMDNSPEGVVYVSFGSAVKPTQMTPEKKETFLETFRQLKTPVIWKWNEDTIPDLPPNVKLSKWLPQQDLLAHPNLKVFVTHGGLLSVQEALYHETPLVGIPLGNDQKPNLLRAQQKGYAIMLDWTTLDTPKLVDAIKTALNDEEMKSKMKKMHDLFTDQKETPVERAVWWVEYVIRNKGAQFLKPASLSLSWYQLYLLDVIGLILLVLFVILFISVKCCICCKNICCGSRNKYKEE